ncbi:hypothetical protein K7432_010718 [Basidiobolus ranarum]|uniref:Uncharacterized protein n=1 Tax=Basidiobolus ranarum TaxID=34480 RepID=A0ABR2WND2_9FUNG
MRIKSILLSITLTLSYIHGFPYVQGGAPSNIYTPHSIRAKMASIAPELSKLTFSANIHNETKTSKETENEYLPESNPNPLYSDGKKSNLNDSILQTIDRFSEPYKQGYHDGLMEGTKKCSS